MFLKWLSILGATTATIFLAKYFYKKYKIWRQKEKDIWWDLMNFKSDLYAYFILKRYCLNVRIRHDYDFLRWGELENYVYEKYYLNHVIYLFENFKYDLKSFRNFASDREKFNSIWNTLRAYNNSVRIKLSMLDIKNKTDMWKFKIFMSDSKFNEVDTWLNYYYLTPEKRSKEIVLRRLEDINLKINKKTNRNTDPALNLSIPRNLRNLHFNFVVHYNYNSKFIFSSLLEDMKRKHITNSSLLPSYSIKNKKIKSNYTELNTIKNDITRNNITKAAIFAIKRLFILSLIYFIIFNSVNVFLIISSIIKFYLYLKKPINVLFYFKNHILIQKLNNIDNINLLSNVDNLQASSALFFGFENYLLIIIALITFYHRENYNLMF